MGHLNKHLKNLKKTHKKKILTRCCNNGSPRQLTLAKTKTLQFKTKSIYNNFTDQASSDCSVFAITSTHTSTSPAFADVSHYVVCFSVLHDLSTLRACAPVCGSTKLRVWFTIKCWKCLVAIPPYAAYRHKRCSWSDGCLNNG